MRAPALGTMLLAFPLALGAQGTEERLAEAKDFYRQLQIERAQAIFQQAVSSNSPFEVTPEQRVEAYLYLGASYATLQQPDSAATYFRAALERDPFADLDPEVFSPDERTAFGQSKLATFRVGIRQFGIDSISPRTRGMALTVVSTHQGAMSVEINAVIGEPLRFALFQGDVDGVQQVSWNGVLPDGTLIEPGSYEVVVVGQSRRVRRADSVRVQFEVEHFLPELLEDTLVVIPRDSLLPERYPSSFALRDLAFGLGVAAGAFIMPRVLGSGELGDSRAQSSVVVGVGALAGIVSFAMRNSNPIIPENIAENARRQARRDLQNLDIAQRNQQRLAQTRVVIIPTSGVTR